MIKVGDIWYRYEDVAYSHADMETGSHSYSTVEVELYEFEVVRVTPRGAWIAMGPCSRFESIHGAARFVLASARKRFVHPTKKEAMASFVARKRRQIQIYEARIARARRALEKAVIRQARDAREEASGG